MRASHKALQKRSQQICCPEDGTSAFADSADRDRPLREGWDPITTAAQSAKSIGLAAKNICGHVKTTPCRDKPVTCLMPGHGNGVFSVHQPQATRSFHRVTMGLPGKSTNPGATCTLRKGKSRVFIASTTADMVFNLNIL